MSRMPTYFISHGGGPWPWMEDRRAQLRPLEESLARMPSELPERPKAILMVSGHWETPGFAVMASPKPPMVYDYFGFPPSPMRSAIQRRVLRNWRSGRRS